MLRSTIEKLLAVLVTPSRYDEQGVRVFRVGINQNGSLGSIAGLIVDYNRRQGHRRQIDFEIFDEQVREPVTAELLRRWRDRAAAQGLPFVLLLCGVQTPFYPRARDIALTARREGITVIAGGVHFTAHGPSVDFMTRCGVSVGIGEVEPIWDRLVDDLFRGDVRPIYRLSAGDGVAVKTAVDNITAPDLEHLPFPYMPRQQMSRYLNPRHLYVDTSRGCPFICSFCSVKNTVGRTMRSRDPGTLVQWIADRVEDGDARWFTFTDDNFVRNPRHIEILEGLAELQRRGRRFSLCVSMDVESACYARQDSRRGERTRRFIALCRAAGVAHVSMGLESTNDAALIEMRKSINRDRSASPEQARRAILARYRAAVLAWQEINASVECGYIIGFDADARGVGRQAAQDMIDIGVDIVNFNLIAPLPGAEDYAKAVREDRLLITDFNECFRHRAMIAHPTLSPSEIEDEVAQAIRRFYSFRNVFSRLFKGLFGIRRPAVRGVWIFTKRQLGFKLMLLSGMQTYADGGLFRQPTSERRMVETDRDALRYYLGLDAPELASMVPESILDDREMDSLPVLARHAIA